MHAECVERIVIAEPGLDDGHHVEADDGGDKPDEEGARQVHRAGRRGDGHQSGHGTRADTYRRGLLVVYPVDGHPRQGGDARGQVGHQEGVGGDAVGLQAAAGVEAEPAQPQESRAHEDERDVVRQQGMTRLIVVSAPHEQGHHQGRDARVDVYHRAAGKVDGPHLLQEAAAPHPVGHGDVGQEAPQHREHQEARELHALGERAQYQGRGDDGEHALEEHEHQFGDVARRQRVRRDAAQHHLVKAAHEPAPPAAALHQPRAEHQAVAESHPHDAHHAHDEQALHQDAQHVLLSHQPAVEKGDAGDCHQ